MRTQSFGIGSFNSVAILNGQLFLAYREGDPRLSGKIVVRSFPVGSTGTDTTLNFEEALPSGSPCFPRLFAYEGAIWLGYHNGSRLKLRNLSSGHVWDFAGYGNDPCCFGGDWFAWQSTPAFDIVRLSLKTADQVDMGKGKPTGLSRVLNTGPVFTIDDDRHALPGATIPCFSDDLAVGEGPNGGCVWKLGGLRGLLWAGKDCFQPKCATSASHVAISAHGPDVRVWVGTRAELQAFVPPPPPPPPVDEPDPIEVPPVSAPELPNYFDHVQARWNDGHGGTSEDAAARFTRIVAYDLHQRDPRVGWWSKENQFGMDPDKLAFNFGNGIYMVDIVANAGALNAAPSWQNDPSHYWFPVPPNNPSGWTKPKPTPGVHTEGPPPDNPPPLDPNNSDPAILARLAALEDMAKVQGMAMQEIVSAINLLSGRVTTLESSPPPVITVPLPEDVVRMSTHEVKTALSFSGTLTGRIVKKG